MKHLGTIQNEFLKISAEKKKTMPKDKSKKTWAEFFRTMGDVEVRNPEPGKKSTIKVKSLRGSPANSPKAQMLNTLYKKWKGGGTKGVKEHVKNLTKKTKLLEKKLREKEKSVKEKLQKEKTKKVEKPKEREKVQTHDDETLSPSAKYKKYLDEQKTLKDKLNTKKQVLEEQKQDDEHEKQIKKQIDDTNDDAQQTESLKLDQLNSKIEEQYKHSVDQANENQKHVKNDISFLKDPIPPSQNSLEEVKKSSDAISRAMKAAKLTGVKIDDVKNAPNALSYEISFDDDESRLKGVDFLTSSKAKSILSSFIGSKQDVIVSEDRESGKVNIEVPKKTRDTVVLKELITDPKLLDRSKKGELVVPVGKDSNGNVQAFSFDKTPHLLVAGGTGSGKSVQLNSMVDSLMATKDPDDVQFVMIDVAKQGNEFGQYNGSPYLASPVATTEADAIKNLQRLVKEGQNRFTKLQELSKKSGKSFKDAASWNKFISKNPDDMDQEEKTAYDKLDDNDRKKMPRIVVVADEVKDLLNSSVNKNAGTTKGYINSILSVARQAGIHVILATQSPSKEAIPGSLQSNLGAKLILKLNVKSDAENVDAKDAVDLLGNGDGYLITDSAPERFQGAFVSGDEQSKFIVNSKSKTSTPALTPTKKNTEPASIKPQPQIEPAQTVSEVPEFEQRIDSLKKRLQIQKEKIQKTLAEAENRSKELQKKQEETKKLEQEQQKKLDEQQQSQNKRKNIEEKDEQFTEGNEPEPTIGQGEVFTSPEDTNVEQESPTIEKSTVNPSTESEQEINDDDIQKMIDEMTKPVSRDEVLNKKEPAKSFEKIPEPEKSKETDAAKDIDQQKKSLLDKFKKLFKNK